MLSMTGLVTIVQEGRFQLLDDDGVSHHVSCFPTSGAHNAASESLSSFRPGTA